MNAIPVEPPDAADDAVQPLDEKRLKLRYAGVCRLCASPIPPRTEAVYDRDTKTVRCLVCVGPANATKPATTREDPGTAGASARREHERRRDARERSIRTAHPKLGGLILALTDDPQSTRAWQSGAIGEELLAARLVDLPDTFRILHDRRIPGTRANIDHIAIGPNGIWVIDAKRYRSKRPSLEVTGGLFRPRTEALRVDGRDRTTLVTGVQSQATRVADALGNLDVPVTGALCFIEADWPLIGGSFTVNGIHVLWPSLLIERMTEDGSAPVDANSIHTQLATAFPPA